MAKGAEGAEGVVVALEGAVGSADGSEERPPEAQPWRVTMKPSTRPIDTR
jgi:hypothetical protein